MVTIIIGLILIIPVIVSHEYEKPLISLYMILGASRIALAVINYQKWGLNRQVKSFLAKLYLHIFIVFSLGLLARMFLVYPDIFVLPFLYINSFIFLLYDLYLINILYIRNKDYSIIIIAILTCLVFFYILVF